MNETTILSSWDLELAVPYGNLHAQHLAVFKHLASRFPGWRHHGDGPGPSSRRVQFMVVSSDSLRRAAALVRLTGPDAPDNTALELRRVQLAVHDGMTIHFSITMSANSHTQDGARKRQIPVSDADLPAFVQRRLLAMGLRPAPDASIRPVRGLFVGKPGRGFGVDAVAVSGRATITDCVALAAAWERGVGRQRTYGLGMLRILAAGEPS